MGGGKLDLVCLPARRPRVVGPSVRVESERNTTITHARLLVTPLSTGHAGKLVQRLIKRLHTMHGKKHQLEFVATRGRAGPVSSQSAASQQPVRSQSAAVGTRDHTPAP